LQGGKPLINIGEFNDLKVIRQTGIGCLLGEPGTKAGEEILLPGNNTIGKKLDMGDSVHAFIYRDSEDRLIATLKEPLAKVGDISYLKVVSNTRIGSFIDIGLERDVLVPMKEQNYRLEEEKKYLFYLYADKTGRLAATTGIDKYLENGGDYAAGDEVKGIVYGFQTNRSAMVAVENLYRGVILKNDYFTNIKPGDELILRVRKRYEDGKMALSPRKTPMDERLLLQETILKYLEKHGGFMPYNDSTSPEKIKEVFHASKKYFKNALGGLLKQGLVSLDADGTRLVSKINGR
jgi:predicted RNA-binding protein (virulence factor B family)